MSYIGDGIGRAMAGAFIVAIVIGGVVAIGLWELIPWLWHHVHWN